MMGSSLPPSFASQNPPPSSERGKIATASMMPRNDKKALRSKCFFVLFILKGLEFIEYTALFHKLIEGAHFGYLSLIENDYSVGISDC